MPRGPVYSDEEPHTVYTTVPRRSYPDEAYGPRISISSAPYRERRPHNYVSLSGSKRTLVGISLFLNYLDHLCFFSAIVP